ncbi:winged helix-turn-helix transcriptional regulator [Thermodesulfobacteriota bacterium]
MDPKDIRTLKLLEEIDNDHVPSQRDLARSLNISLGLVNSFIKRLAHKGYFKVTTIPKNRVKYILTPKGAAEKTRLTYEYIQYSYEFYRSSRRRLRDLFKKLEEKKIRRIAFFGATDLAEIAYLSLQETTIELVAVVDAEKIGKKFLGFKIIDPKDLNLVLCDKILITEIDLITNIFERLKSEGLDHKILMPT